MYRDVFGLADSAICQEFVYRKATSDTVFEVWNRPRGATMAGLFVMGGGGGGAPGLTGAATTARNGGGAGGSAAIARCIIPIFALPDKLYIRVGIAGIGGSTAQATGNRTYISVSPDLTATNIVIQSGAAAAAHGANGGSGGSGETISTGLLSFWTAMGITTFVAGATGAAGGGSGGAVGVDFSGANSSSCVYGGAGGGGVTTTDFAGGGQVPENFYPSLPGGLAAGGNGQSGRQLWRPFFGYGGCGGGTNNSGTGGKGGAGALGCGGGGGGGGTTGGAGGAGGDGIAVIISW